MPFESARACLCFVSLVSLLCLLCCETGRTALSVQSAAPACSWSPVGLLRL